MNVPQIQHFEFFKCDDLEVHQQNFNNKHGRLQYFTSSSTIYKFIIRLLKKQGKQRKTQKNDVLCIRSALELDIKLVPLFTYCSLSIRTSYVPADETQNITKSY